jgi:hypothetical protein
MQGNEDQITEQLRYSVRYPMFCLVFKSGRFGDWFLSRILGELTQFGPTDRASLWLRTPYIANTTETTNEG